MKKLLTLALAITMLFAFAATVMAAGTVEVEGFAFHCNSNGGNGKTYIKDKPKDFGKKELIELTRNKKDPTIWDANVSDWVCTTCGCKEWISFSNKSGVPNGKNIQLTHPVKGNPEEPGIE